MSSFLLSGLSPVLARASGSRGRNLPGLSPVLARASGPRGRDLVCLLVRSIRHTGFVHGATIGAAATSLYENGRARLLGPAWDLGMSTEETGDQANNARYQWQNTHSAEISGEIDGYWPGRIGILDWLVSSQGAGRPPRSRGPFADTARGRSRPTRRGQSR